MADETTKSEYFPWTWTIESLDQTNHKCPSVSHLLGTFAAVNGVVSLLAVFFGHRLVVKKLTCGFFGRRGSRAWVWMWILPVGLQLAANVCIALLIKKSGGYTADFSISELMLFLVARPRLSWIVLGAFAFKSTKNKPEKEKVKPTTTPNPNEYMTPQPYQQTWHSNPSFTSHASYNSHNSYHSYSSQTPLYPYPPANNMSQASYHRVQLSDDEEEPNLARGHGYFYGNRDFPWWSAFMSQFIGEFILQIITLYIMGRTAHFATQHGYYTISSRAYWELPSSARMMYSGALYYLVAGSLFLICAGLFILYAVTSQRTKIFGKASSAGIFFALSVLLVSTWMGSWIFWAGFVKLAGNLYCPPKLIHQGVIWTFFSTIGILVGTGV